MMSDSRESRYQGSALVICLMVLVILTLLGTTAIMNTGMETKTVHNTRKSEEAFYAAEAGIEHFLSLQNLDSLKPHDVIESHGLISAEDRYGPRYRVTILDLVRFNWGVTVCTIESVGFSANEQAKRVLRSSIQLVADESSYDNPGTYRDYSHSPFHNGSPKGNSEVP